MSKIDSQRMMWSRILETWPEDWNSMLFFEYIHLKDSYEVQVYFEDEDQSLRADYEFLAESFSQGHWHDWTEEDVNLFIDNLRAYIEENINDEVS